ncbi:hypothetical protein VNO80_06259 [Phaseolus coccineus]|uniref:Uncharacterized protein n=1 Tax=Phaseolus coccineus TaxID=3886 RepID=A0AAN9NGK2_PHACN
MNATCRNLFRYSFSANSHFPFYPPSPRLSQLLRSVQRIYEEFILISQPPPRSLSEQLLIPVTTENSKST